MAKIFSVLTLLIALGATFLGFKSKELVEKLQANAAIEHADLLKTRDDLKKTKAELKDTQDKLKATEEELASTKTKLRETEDNLKKTNDELTNTKTMLNTVTAELDSLKKKLAEIDPNINPADLQKQIEGMKAAKAELEAKVKTLEIEVAELKTTVETLSINLKSAEEKVATQGKVIKKYKDGIMDKGTRGTVMAVNAGWGFCVLSIGDKQGAAANRVLIVTRGGQAIGKVKITNVEASQSVADIIPGTFLKGTYVEPGDGVIYTGDDKVRIEEPEATPAATNRPPAPAPPSGLPLPN